MDHNQRPDDDAKNTILRVVLSRQNEVAAACNNASNAYAHMLEASSKSFTEEPIVTDNFDLENVINTTAEATVEPEPAEISEVLRKSSSSKPEFTKPQSEHPTLEGTSVDLERIFSEIEAAK